MLKPDDLRNRVCCSIEASLTVKQRLLASAEVVSSIATVCEIVAGALDDGCKLLLFGNGGSAADAQHIAAELVGTLRIRSSGFAGIGTFGEYLLRYGYRQRLRIRQSFFAAD